MSNYLHSYVSVGGGFNGSPQDLPALDELFGAIASVIYCLYSVV